MPTSGTSKKSGSKILGVVAREEAECLLIDWANLSDSADALQRFARRHGRVLGPPWLMFLDNSVIRLRNYLRKAWDAQDRRARDWYAYDLRGLFAILCRTTGAETRPSESDEKWEEWVWLQNDAERWDKWLGEPPPLTALEVTMFYFQTSIAERAKHCGGPECPAPYFIATKRWQKYCSPECTGPSTRESKREWWRKNRAKNEGVL